MLPVLPFSIRRMGGGALDVALVFSAFSVCQFAAAPLLGRASDRWGRRPVLVSSQLGTLVGFVVLALARTPGEVLVSRIVDGVTAGNLAVVYAAVCDLYPPEDRAQRFAVLNTAAGAGILLGLGLCAALTSNGLPTLAGVAGVAALVTVVASASVTFPVPTGAGRIRWTRSLVRAPASLRRSGALTVVVQVLIGAFALALPALLHATIAAPARTGVLVAATGLLIGVVAQSTLGVHLLRHAGDRMTAAVALMAVDAGLLALWLAALVNGSGEHLMAGGIVGDLVARGTGPVGLLISGGGAALVAAGLLTGLSAATAWLSSEPGLPAGLLMGMSQSLASVGQLAGPAIGFLALAAAPDAFLGALAALTVAGLFACSKRAGPAASGPAAPGPAAPGLRLRG